MSITIGITLLVRLAGLVIYLIVKKDSKWFEIGRLMFFVGLFWMVHEIGSKVVHW